MPAAPRLLVTGFGPFPGAPENPTAALVESLAREPAEHFGAAAVRGEILPTEYRRSWSVMRRLNAAFAPDVVVHFGLSGRAEAMTIESVARRRIDPARPDAVGYAPSSGFARTAGPDTVRGDWPADEIASLLVQAGFPAVVSEDAGDYVCNATFYRSLRARHAENRVVGFVHVPSEARNGFTQARLREAAALVLNAATRNRATGRRST